MEVTKEKGWNFSYRLFCPKGIFYLYFISIYSVLNTLLECTIFYISKKITSCTFCCLFLKSSKASSVFLINNLYQDMYQQHIWWTLFRLTFLRKFLFKYLEAKYWNYWTVFHKYYTRTITDGSDFMWIFFRRSILNI